nr:MAG TPA: hypothetical protein [Caudoviricetes sp.]
MPCHIVIIKVFYPLFLIVSYKVGVHFHPRLTFGNTLD